ncbi:MAG: cytochrome C [Deltaproteobacteria bacterium]|nr:cytochrome C [Deltaproteobacteria bacterium]
MIARVLISFLFVWLLPAGLRAADPETLLMPGPVIEGHAEIEEECTSCHRPFDRSAEDGLCLGCHEDVGADLTAGKGFHGLAPGLAATACRSCHTDHRGRQADVVGLNPATFDHGLTDYPLQGAHVPVPCADCHVAEKKHREASLECVSCHEGDDVHRGGLGEDCSACHEDSSWKKATFDHDTTKFRLEGAHEDVACRLCHADERFEKTPSDCATCHVSADVHKGSFGPQCGDCHDANQWKSQLFDHDRDTKFPLDGKHVGADCGACHKGQLYDDPAPTDCNACHQADDVHGERNGDQCQDCHATRSWVKIAFDHDEDTKWPLRGGHAQVLCESCHPGNLDDPVEKECLGCHQADDVHRGQQGEECASCHDENSWTETVGFDHDLTHFPLLGLHATVACEECHTTHAYADAETDCVACHRPDDKHEQRLTEACASCHNPNGWAIWHFDHDAQSDFPLHGAHEGVDCTTCHVEQAPEKIELADECGSCHLSDDVHRGAFGRDCGRCHGEQDWTKVKLGR